MEKQCCSFNWKIHSPTPRCLYKCRFLEKERFLTTGWNYLRCISMYVIQFLASDPFSSVFLGLIYDWTSASKKKPKLLHVVCLACGTGMRECRCLSSANTEIVIDVQAIRIPDPQNFSFACSAKQKQNKPHKPPIEAGRQLQKNLVT